MPCLCFFQGDDFRGFEAERKASKGSRQNPSKGEDFQLIRKFPYKCSSHVVVLTYDFCHLFISVCNNGILLLFDLR